LNTTLNLVIVSHTVCVHVKSSKKFLERARWYPVPYDRALVLRTLETHTSSTCLRLYHAEFGRSRSNSMGSQNWDTLSPAPLKMRAYLIPRNTPFPTRYHSKFGRSAQTVWVSVGSQKFEGAWSPLPMDGACLTYDHPSFPSCVTLPNLVVVGQTVWASEDIPKILGTLGIHPSRWERV